MPKSNRFATHFVMVLSLLIWATAANAIPFFFVFPIPKGSADPDKINATLDQRKLAMCAAYHQNVIDPEINGKKEDSFHGDIVRSAMNRLENLSSAKRLVGAYIGQWRLQSKQSYQAGQNYGKMLIEGCNYSNLPVIKAQYDVWNNNSSTSPHAQAQINNIPPKPIKLDGVIRSTDFPSGVSPEKSEYVVGMVLQIDRNGNVADCFIEASSGSETLDDATCNLLKQRAKFSPAVEGGYVAVSDFKYTQHWKPTIGYARNPSSTKPEVEARKSTQDQSASSASAQLRGLGRSITSTTPSAPPSSAL